MNTPFEITKEEVLQLASQKLVDQFGDYSELEARAVAELNRRVENLVSEKLKSKVDSILTKEMESILSKEIVPVDMWGERSATPTTIRAQLAERARDFWNVKVDGEGKEASWGGSPRHEQLMKRILKEEFSKAVKENAEVIISEFKAALKADGVKLVTEHIDSLIRTK